MGQKGSSEQRDGSKTREDSSAADDNHKCRVCRFPLLVALSQLLLGVAVTVVAFLMLAISPSLLARETPHWAGIFMCVVAIVGFILYCVTYRPDERSTVQFIVKLLYFVFSTIGLVISVLVVAFAGYHHAQTSSFSCLTSAEACVCTLDPRDPIARTFTYEGVSDCQEITETLVLYHMLQIVLNLAQAFFCAVATFIMWKHRYQVFFSGLQIGSLQRWNKI
ncbi:sarcospan [Corythoichthys intestinalis]|uniref:sarcospan n=1 Tax=Corythoichthys intestinalis TaxID=161448 RepID=UPI0025A62BFD|nr:sarcospan [Corythoichthys intestinalis]